MTPRVGDQENGLAHRLTPAVLIEVIEAHLYGLNQFVEACWQVDHMLLESVGWSSRGAVDESFVSTGGLAKNE